MTARETRTSTICIFKLENKQACTLWTRFFDCSTFRSRSLPINGFKLPVLKLHGGRDLTRYFVFVFFTKRWWQFHSSIIGTHFARGIILNKQEGSFRWCSRCLFMISSHWVFCQSIVHMNGSEQGNFPNNELSFPYANQFIEREKIWK